MARGGKMIMGKMARPRYPRYDRLLEARRSERKRRAIDALRRADALARSEGGKLIVFGSLVEGGFDERSDIDVALTGLAESNEIRLLLGVERILAEAGFATDVIVERHMPESLRRRVRNHGREISHLG
jgi:predicted nucleotidyltransferase